MEEDSIAILKKMTFKVHIFVRIEPIYTTKNNVNGCDRDIMLLYGVRYILFNEGISWMGLSLTANAQTTLKRGALFYQILIMLEQKYRALPEGQQQRSACP